MIDIKKPKEIDKIRDGGKLLAETLGQLKNIVEPGITTAGLNQMAVDLAADKGAQPSFYKYQGFPAGLCVSVNEELVHGLPGDREIATGDIVSMDFGLIYQGFYTDMAITVGVGDISPEAKRIMEITEKSLMLGIEQIKPGNHIGDISAAVQKHAESNGYGIVRNLTGHGVGREVHEPPQIPNFGEPGAGPELKEGMVLAIEPMLSVGDPETKLADDGWTFAIKDGSLSAHFEHTIAVTSDGYEILTQ